MADNLDTVFAREVETGRISFELAALQEEGDKSPAYLFQNKASLLYGAEKLYDDFVVLEKAIGDTDWTFKTRKAIFALLQGINRIEAPDSVPITRCT